MKLPSKVTAYKDSTISKFPIVLTKIQQNDYPISILFEELKGLITIEDYIDVLDSLFILGQITLEKEILHYVKRDTI